MKRIILWPALLMALAWQCWAIEISVDTLLTSSSPYDATAHLTIKNTNTVDTVYIDSIYVCKLSPFIVCNQIGFQDAAHDCCLDIISPAPLPPINDSCYVATKILGYGSSYLMSIAPHDSLVLRNVVVGSCLNCSGVRASSYSDQCILKATFVPNKGARDSVVFIGPRITGGTKFKAQSNVVVPEKSASPMKLYDLSGRCVDKLSVRKHGVFIATYGHGNLVRKLMISD